MPALRTLPTRGSRNTSRQQGVSDIPSLPNSDPIPISSSGRSQMSRPPRGSNYDNTPGSSPAAFPIQSPSLSRPRINWRNWCRQNREAILTSRAGRSTNQARGSTSEAGAGSLALPSGLRQPVNSGTSPGGPTSGSAPEGSGAGPTPVLQEEEEEEDFAHPIMFMWESEESEISAETASYTSQFTAETASESSSDLTGLGLGWSSSNGLFAPPLAVLNSEPAFGEFTSPRHAGYATAAGAYASDDGEVSTGDSSSEAYTNLPGSIVGQPQTPVFHAHDPDMDTGHNVDVSPKSGGWNEHAPLLLDSPPPYMPPRENGREHFSRLEHAALNAGTVDRFAAYARSLQPPTADPRRWAQFFGMMVRMLSFMMRQSRHLASFWTLIIFCCFFVARAQGCCGDILKDTWGHIMYVRRLSWEFNKRSKLSIVRQCRARITGLVADELAVNRFLNLQRIKDSGYIEFGHGPAQRRAATASTGWHQPQFPLMPLDFSIPSTIPKLVYDLMGGRNGRSTYDQVCDALGLSHLLIYQSLPVPIPPMSAAPPVEAEDTNNRPHDDVWA